MTVNRVGKFTFACICTVLMLSSSLKANEQDGIEVINRFIQKITEYKQLDKEQAAEVTDYVKELRDDEYARSAAITEGLAMIYPKFADALEKLGEDDVQPAINVLKELAKSDDPYLAAEATFFMGRASMFQQEFEKAIPMLEQVLDKHAKTTVQTGNALYFMGIARANMLENKEAVKTLKKFIDEYPNASERMRISAMSQIQVLSAIESGSMLDVYQRMNFSHTRLKTGKTDDVTKREQDKIVDMLSKMIKEQEKKEGT